MSFVSFLLGSLTTNTNPQHSESSTTQPSPDNDNMASTRHDDRNRIRSNTAQLNLRAGNHGKASPRAKPYPSSRAEVAQLKSPSRAQAKRAGLKKNNKKQTKNRPLDSEEDYNPKNITPSSSSRDSDKSNDSDDSSIILLHDAPPSPATPRPKTSGLQPARGRRIPSTPSGSKKADIKQDATGSRAQSTQRMYAAATFRLSNGPIDDELIKKIMKVVEEMTPGRDLDVTYTSLVDLDD
ncbi:hypothetical protein CPLU01_09826 [Colletotrichum plurivorum]|uniref:Uncharacterized protein n=1 Tax=Colletotrichum plurivorum TaxID=2175906 RepID=A0A8H6K716_9PEZI|nr:hypothetical protein CPLU01_09826 [Colletotrichum plurivorum]